MIILFISNNTSDLTNFRAELIRTLHCKGLKIYALAPNYNDETRKELESLGAEPLDYPLCPTGMNPVMDLKSMYCLVRILRRLKPDIVMCRAAKPVIYGLISAYLARVKKRVALIEGLGYVFNPSEDRTSIKRILLKKLVSSLYKLGLSCANTVVFLNPDDQREFIDKRLLSIKKSFLLGGIGVDLKKWQSKPPVIDPVTFILVARMLREKGIEQYAEAARIVKKRYPRVRYILLGGLDENPGALTQKDIKMWVDEGILEWHGHVPVQQWITQSSVFVLPSYYREGVPASTQEAMAMGRAIITTDAPGCRETVIDGENGFLIPVRNHKVLAEKMIFFIEQKDMIVRMGESSRRIAEERFDVHKVNKRLISLLMG